ncbi:hypothetical protein E2C01_037929 [Portunus trituberculatus]|uniref:Uncharacterized protein n=1 Tax=Portunus trituberculatus TaxID=210409 RepID=A0A5B7F9G2_PORTR|nr:hypothetical protein [Portunus trituberculatus]
MSFADACCVPPAASAPRLCGQQAEWEGRMTVKPNRKPAVDGRHSQAQPTMTPCTPAARLSPRPKGTRSLPLFTGRQVHSSQQNAETPDMSLAALLSQYSLPQ